LTALISNTEDIMTETYILTKMDIAALRKADRLCVHFNGRDPDKNLVQAIKENRPSEANPYAQDIEYRIAMPVKCRAYDGLCGYVSAEDIKAVTCFAHIGFHHSQHTPASTIVQMLRAGDEAWFEFTGDAHTTDAMDRHGEFHGDELTLHVERGAGKARKHLKFVMDYAICRDNSARMVRGLPRRRKATAA
jgi:hypothetical protein